MPDQSSVTAPQGPSPYQIAMDFATFKAQVYDDLTGSKSVIEQRGEITTPDGTKYPNLVQVVEPDPDAIPICNGNGAKRFLHQLGMLMNPHTSLGDLKDDDIPEIAENAVRQAGVVMMANAKEYGVTNLNKLEAEGLTLFDTFYIFLTSLKKAGIRAWSGSLYQIKIENKGTGQPVGLTGT